MTHETIKQSYECDQISTKYRKKTFSACCCPWCWFCEKWTCFRCRSTRFSRGFERCGRLSKEENKFSFHNLVSVSFKSKNQFCYADRLDKIGMFLGVIFSIGTGMLIPMNLIIYFDLVNTFIENGPDTIMQEMEPITIRFAIFAAISVAIPFGQMACLKISAKRQVRRMRLAFFRVSKFISIF